MYKWEYAQMKKKRSILILFIIIAAVLELCVFNYDALRSWTNEGYAPAYVTGAGLTLQEDGRYLVTGSAEANLQIFDIQEKLDYIKLDITFYDASGNVLPTDMKPYLADEGHYNYYYQGDISSYGDIENLKYYRLHPYGEVEKLCVNLNVSDGCYVEIGEVELEARVPFQVRPLRVMVLLLVAGFIYVFLPGSRMYEQAVDCKNKKQLGVVIGILAVNIALIFTLIKVNPAFSGDLRWDHHYQYHRLAESILQGHVWLDYGDATALESLENPYDFDLRRDTGVSEHWDTAYFEGKYYVYFGIVPVLLFYLPYYMLTGLAFPTWAGVFLSMAGIVSGAFYLVYQLIKRWFSDASFGHYLLLALLLANGTGVMTLALRPDFYTLPIVLALAFSLWGVGFWLRASLIWEEKKVWGYLLIGSLCMALTAGCRPQFLMGSFLIFPVLGTGLLRKWGKEEWKRVVTVAVPYVVVAVCLMIYNYIRFGSPFDFGASYNLTTNDMTRRGFYLGRIGEGIFQYLFQLPVITTGFPFVRETALSSDYLGQTIRESFFGGILISHFALCANFCYGGVHRQMKPVETKAFWGVCTLSSLVILVADTAMSGIIVRYMTDFSWMLFLGAIIVLLQMLTAEDKQKKITVFLIVAFICMAAFDLLVGLQLTELSVYDAARYYEIKSFFM